MTLLVEIPQSPGSNFLPEVFSGLSCELHRIGLASTLCMPELKTKHFTVEAGIRQVVEIDELIANSNEIHGGLSQKYAVKEFNPYGSKGEKKKAHLCYPEYKRPAINGPRFCNVAFKTVVFLPHFCLFTFSEALKHKCANEVVQDVANEVDNKKRKGAENRRRERHLVSVFEQPTDGPCRKSQFSTVVGKVAGIVLILFPKSCCFHETPLRLAASRSRIVCRRLRIGIGFGFGIRSRFRWSAHKASSCGLFVGLNCCTELRAGRGIQAKGLDTPESARVACPRLLAAFAALDGLDRSRALAAIGFSHRDEFSRARVASDLSCSAFLTHGASSDLERRFTWESATASSATLPLVLSSGRASTAELSASIAATHRAPNWKSTAFRGDVNDARNCVTDPFSPTYDRAGIRFRRRAEELELNDFQLRLPPFEVSCPRLFPTLCRTELDASRSKVEESGDESFFLGQRLPLGALFGKSVRCPGRLLPFRALSLKAEKEHWRKKSRSEQERPAVFVRRCRERTHRNLEESSFRWAAFPPRSAFQPTTVMLWHGASYSTKIASPSVPKNHDHNILWYHDSLMDVSGCALVSTEYSLLAHTFQSRGLRRARRNQCCLLGSRHSKAALSRVISRVSSIGYAVASSSWRRRMRASPQLASFLCFCSISSSERRPRESASLYVEKNLSEC